jgi:adenylosuccinate synthase
MSLFSTNSVNTKCYVILGAQWGDEGKGKIVDCLADKADIVVRSQGGSNAGHTVARDGRVYKLHLIPSGILSEKCQNYVMGGMVIDIRGLLEEMEDLQAQSISVVNRLWISSYAHITLPYHKLFDKLQEQSKGSEAIGTTGRGIGPTYADRTNRIGIKMADFIDPVRFRLLLTRNVAAVNKQLVSLYNEKPLDAGTLFKEYSILAERIKPFVRGDLEIELNKEIRAGKTVLLEGAQGTWLDNIYGTTPFTTSSQTISSGVVSASAIGPTMIRATIPIAKAYTTRVGAGPMPTEWNESECVNFNHAEAGEVGTSTGRKRRIGWFDAPLVKSAVLINGAEQMVLTKLDILDTYKKIKICVAYEFEGNRYDYVPGHIDLNRLTPIYEEIEGWCQPTEKCTRYEELPSQAKAYIKRIEELCAAKISIISVGKDRDQTIYV